MTLSLERFEVRAMIDDLLDTVGPLVEQRGNVLTVSCADEVGSMVADFMKTRQILLNLLSNAGKFTRDGAITLDVRQRRPSSGRPCVQFSVTDTGVGMTPQQTDRIFDAVHPGRRDDDRGNTAAPGWASRSCRASVS